MVYRIYSLQRAMHIIGYKLDYLSKGTTYASLCSLTTRQYHVRMNRHEIQVKMAERNKWVVQYCPLDSEEGCRQHHML
jgi:hypothetical protein